MKNQDNQTMEIDVLSLVKTLWRRKFLIVVTAFAMAIVALGYSAFIIKPNYTSTTRIYVVNRQANENSTLTNQDLQAGTYLVKDYKEIILSQDVLAKVIDDLKLNVQPSALAKKINVTVPTDTRIVSIAVSDGDAKEAARIANSLRQIAAEKIIAVTKVSDVTTLEEAEVPNSPSSPNIRRNTLIGFLAGGVLISVVILVVEVLDDRVKKPEDVEEALGITLLGVVPNMNKLLEGKIMPSLELAKNKEKTIKKTEEYYNALRTNIQLSGDNIKVIAVTSVQSGEGKSTTSTNLAIAFARSGYNTLLIDADIRNSVMSGIFKTRDKITGLTDYLAGATDLSNGLCETNIDNLFVIEAGQVSPNPTALLQSKNFGIMIDILRNHYDYIVVDTPPIGLVIDAAIIAQKCDASVLVVESGNVKRKTLQKAKEQLEQTGTPFLGVILNKYDTQLEKYGSYGNYGNYGNYGKKK